ncbi:hypothetical protein LWI29_008781 [Acer saccharum]|uniref:Uncharacterized protein n=1 Tax=Acer saccharum TaxID=4024 RepID=A0AA39VKV2_ACESA|nr:hypothetical protein LWI29_008781 [Acer saccharum]
MDIFDDYANFGGSWMNVLLLWISFVIMLMEVVSCISTQLSQLNHQLSNSSNPANQAQQLIQLSQPTQLRSKIGGRCNDDGDGTPDVQRRRRRRRRTCSSDDGDGKSRRDAGGCGGGESGGGRLKPSVALRVRRRPCTSGVDVAVVLARPVSRRRRRCTCRRSWISAELVGWVG